MRPQLPAETFPPSPPSPSRPGAHSTLTRYLACALTEASRRPLLACEERQGGGGKALI